MGRDVVSREPHTMTEVDDIDELLVLFRTVDSFAAIEQISLQPDPERAATLFGQLAKRLYATEKDVAGSVAVRHAGIQFCLYTTAHATKRQALRPAAKALAFNLAADTWPGWGDEGITINASDLSAGLDAARLNLRLARELQRGPLAESRGHWLLGAHWLARAKDDEALNEFSRAREQALTAADHNNELLNTGYAALTGVLRGTPDARTAFAKAVAELRQTEEDAAAAFADQLEKALAVLSAAR
jgi:hypothetical protein